MTDRAADNSDCQQWRQIYHDRADGLAADAAVEGAFAAHVAACPACRRDVAQMDALCAGLDGLRDETADVGSRVRVRFGRLLKAAAVIAMIVGAGLYFLYGGSSQEEPVVRQVVERPVEEPGPAEPAVRASVELRGKSADSFVTMEHKTNRPGVHLFIMYPRSQAAIARSDL